MLLYKNGFEDETGIDDSFSLSSIASTRFFNILIKRSNGIQALGSRKGLLPVFLCRELFFKPGHSVWRDNDTDPWHRRDPGRQINPGVLRITMPGKTGEWLFCSGILNHQKMVNLTCIQPDKKLIGFQIPGIIGIDGEVVV